MEQEKRTMEKKEEFHKIIDDIENPKMIDYLLNLVKNFLELRS